MPRAARGQDECVEPGRTGRPRRGTTPRHRPPFTGAARARPSKIVVAPRRAVERFEGEVEPKSEVSRVRSVDRKTAPFEKHREVGRLLELGQQYAVTDGMRSTGRDEDGVPGGNGQAAERPEHALGVLALDPAGDDFGRGFFPEADAHSGCSIGLEDDPRLGFPEGRSEVSPSEGIIGMEVNRKPFACIEQLDEQRDVCSESGNVLGTEISLGLVTDRFLQAGPVGQPADTCTWLSEGRRQRSDPLLGSIRIRRAGCPERTDPSAAPVEAMKLVGSSRAPTPSRAPSRSSESRPATCGGVCAPPR